MCFLRFFIYRFVIVLISTLVLSNVYSSTSSPNIPKVIMLGISGIRDQENVYMSSLLKELGKEGSLYNNLNNENNQMHMPAFQSAISGELYPDLNLNRNLKSPSIFQHVMKKYKLIPKSKFWIIGSFSIKQMMYGGEKYVNHIPAILPVNGKDIEQNILNNRHSSFDGILNSNHIDFFKKYKLGGSWPHWDTFSEMYFNIMKDVLVKKEPYILLGMTGEAETAHYATWAKYVIALKNQSIRVKKIYDYLKKSKFYRDNTYFLLFVDHSRDRYYMDHNEDSIKNRSTSWLYIRGPGVPKGEVFSRKIVHRDIFTTLSKIYKIYKIEKMKGNPLEEIFQFKDSRKL